MSTAVRARRSTARKATSRRPTARKTTSRRPTAKKTTTRRPTTSRATTERNQNPRFATVSLRVNKIECIKTTKEIDRDEIKLAAITTQGQVKASGSKKKLAARAERGEVLDAGKFKNGETRNYRRPREIARFKAGGRDGWPRYYHATLLMIEEDEGAIGKIVNEAVKSVEKEAAAAISTAAASATSTALAAVLAGSAAGSAVPLIGTAVGAAAGAAVGVAAAPIKKAHEDDVFDPKHIQLRLTAFPRRAGVVEGSRRTAIFRGFKGVYRVTYTWAVS